ncbi:MAG: hypothetical protein ABJC39_10900 [Chloroflexota bacterium]
MPTVRRSLVLIMAGLSAGAAVIHFAAAPGHYAEIGGLAIGFVASGGFQAVWVKACLAGPSSRTMTIGIVVNLAIVAAWAYTRTVGLPVGEFAGSPEPIGLPDGASVVFELLLVGGLLLAWFRVDVPSHRSRARAMASIAVVPVIGLIAVTTSLATISIASGHDHEAAAAGSTIGEPNGVHRAAP